MTTTSTGPVDATRGNPDDVAPPSEMRLFGSTRVSDVLDDLALAFRSDPDEDTAGRHLSVMLAAAAPPRLSAAALSLR
ncbi:MAG: hypothetical protein JJU45_18555 [Acidimicrobiia bacterium]|nr:hypothetical protein [Acidimicrobiia bacterium]